MIVPFLITAEPASLLLGNLYPVQRPLYRAELRFIAAGPASLLLGNLYQVQRFLYLDRAVLSRKRFIRDA